VGEISVRRLAGMMLVALSAAGFGTLALFGRYAYADGMDALTILVLRFSLAAVLMLALLIVRREPLPRDSALLRLIGMGAIGYVGQSFAYLTALKYASAGLVALLLYLYPILVALLAALVLRERLTPLKQQGRPRNPRPALLIDDARDVTPRRPSRPSRPSRPGRPSRPAYPSRP
jgi:drug/metabolite transporter (DMT)-like permease